MTDTKHPEALRLIEQYDYGGPVTHSNKWNAAACNELRRLHAENAALQQVYDAARLEIEHLRGVTKSKLLAQPVAWMVYLPSIDTQHLYYSQEDMGYVDDVTNHADAEVTPLYEMAAPKAEVAPAGEYPPLPEPKFTRVVDGIHHETPTRGAIMKAILVKDNLPDFNGHAALYRMDPPHDGHEFVIASASSAIFTGPETYIFPADADGEVVSWAEMDGSYRGGLSHAKAFAGAGYSIEQPELPGKAANSELEDADPLQGAANWLVKAHSGLETSTLAGKLSIGYNRAKRLHDAAIAARKQGANHD